MASILPVGGKWRAQVRRKGFAPQTRTFERRAHAVAWARATEAAIDAGRAMLARPSAIRVSVVLRRYIEEMAGPAGFGRNKRDVLAKIDAALGDETLASLTAERIVRYIVRERDIAGPTAGIDLTYLGGVLKVARKVWKMPADPSAVEDARDMLRHMGRLARSTERERRPTADELHQLKEYLGEHSRMPMADILDFLVASCMRAGEVGRLLWADLDEHDRTIVIRDRKDPRAKAGNHQTVPLLGEAFAIVQRQPRTHERIFPYNTDTWSTIFPRACAKLGIKDLRLHDLRHEGISRLVESGKYSIPEVMLVSGHRDPRMLMRYVQLRARDLHGRTT